MATHGNRRATVFARTISGNATFEPDPGHDRAWTVTVDGVPQSYVDLADPAHLAFEYVRRLATILRLARAPGVPMKILHLGGGGLTLPRWVAATRPGSHQTVVELDPLLLAAVARTLPWPPEIGIEIADARTFVDTQAFAGATPEAYAGTGGYDAIVVDVFQGSAMPESVAGTSFAHAAARLLRPGGVLAMNLTDVRPPAHSRIQAATLRTAFADVALIAPPGMLRGRKLGNVVLAASAICNTLPVSRIARSVAWDREPARVWHGEELTTFLGGARARLDGFP
ncbi:fused MFS/spermidine synthase [Winogradskya consettensis]|uniref:Spermidine synthase n=1 Tax=Winogradskya consettensis TaxID=113560 RepID=A0A919VUR6_9ACTN|nr:fused MFS/spermidine synthase [Actinoplanes consettensis]GIM76000.1 hypothetical protein Aco04nite_48150 [Actinoplanes consettensis]